MEKQTLTVEEAAEILGIGRSSAYEAIRTGQLPVIRIGRRVLVPYPALRRMLETMESVAGVGTGTGKSRE